MSRAICPLCLIFSLAFIPLFSGCGKSGPTVDPKLVAEYRTQLTLAEEPDGGQLLSDVRLALLGIEEEVEVHFEGDGHDHSGDDLGEGEGEHGEEAHEEEHSEEAAEEHAEEEHEDAEEAREDEDIAESTSSEELDLEKTDLAEGPEHTEEASHAEEAGHEGDEEPGHDDDEHAEHAAEEEPGHDEDAHAEHAEDKHDEEAEPKHQDDKAEHTIAGPTEPMEVVLVGQVGGLANPWKETQPDFPFAKNKAVVFLADPLAVIENEEAGHAHAPGEECPFCEAHAADRSEMLAMVRFVNKKGDVLPMDVRDLFDVKITDTVVVHGSARIVEGGMMVVDASGLYIRR